MTAKYYRIEVTATVEGKARVAELFRLVLSRVEADDYTPGIWATVYDNEDHGAGRFRITDKENEWRRR